MSQSALFHTASVDWDYTVRSRISQDYQCHHV